MNVVEVKKLLKTHLSPLSQMCFLMNNNLSIEKNFETFLLLCYNQIMDTKSFESIIPTALHTQYPLTFTDIPFSKGMFNELCKAGFPENFKNDTLAIELEARYKLIDKLLEQSGCTQILELACGYTTRGLAWCTKNQNIKYVEFDLPQIINTKIRLIKNFSEIPSNLKFVSGNALCQEDINSAIANFDISKPIAVINQGLMRYLNFDEKEILAKNIYEVIKRNNGCRITCDVTPAKFIQTQNKNISANYNKNLTAITDRNNASWRFKNREHVNDFATKIGFNVEWHDFMEVLNELSSSKNLGISKVDAAKYLENPVVVMRKA